MRYIRRAAGSAARPPAPGSTCGCCRLPRRSRRRPLRRRCRSRAKRSGKAGRARRRPAGAQAAAMGAASRARPRQSLAAAGTGQRPQAPPRRHVGGRAADAGAAHPGACGGDAPKAGSRAGADPRAGRPGCAAADGTAAGVRLFNEDGQVEKLSLEDYVVGVVAAEMPAEFDLEALKAQAVALAPLLSAGSRTGIKAAFPVCRRT